MKARERNNLLLAIDRTESSRRAIEAAGWIAASQDGAIIHLLHVFKPIPPELLEFGGAEIDTDEEGLEERLQYARRQWLKAKRKELEPLFSEARRALEDSGVKPSGIVEHSCSCVSSGDLVPAIVAAARRYHCRLIAVGAGTVQGLRKYFGKSLGEQLLRRCRNLSVLITP